MKKIFFAVILILAGIVSFSFLIDINKNENSSIFVYLDRGMEHRGIIEKEVNRIFLSNKIYEKVIFSTFDPKNLDSYIVSNGKNSIFITPTPLKSEIFSLKSTKYESTIVAATSLSSPIDNIDSSTLISLYKKSDYHSIENIKKIINKNLKIAVLPYYNLTIKVKPLKVDGIFPSIYNIKKGMYPGTIKIFISTISNKLYRFCKKNCTVNEGERIFSIIAGGDIMLGRAVGKYITRYGIYYPFENIKDLIRANDIAFANLESPLTNGGEKLYPNKGIYFKANPMTAMALKWCGFNAVSLANNHIFDWGITGALDTENYLKKAGIKYSGIGKSLKEALKPAVFNINGTKVCIMSMDDIFPTEIKNGKKILRSYTYNEHIKQDIINLKKRYDIVIVSYHTGVEYLKHPGTEKIYRMRSLIDYGADIVFGSHPHVVQDIEIYKNGLIAYSLGNLIFDQNWSPDTSKGLLLEVGIYGNRPLYFRPIFINIVRGQAALQHISSGEDIKLVMNF